MSSRRAGATARRNYSSLPMTRVAKWGGPFASRGPRELCSIVMKTRLPLLACCLLAFAVQAQETKVQMWKWTDANGVVHYSDVPGPGAVQVGLSVSQGQPGSAAPAPSAGGGESYSGEGNEDTSSASDQSYTSLQIVKPENGASFFTADSVVTVQISPSPGLMSGDSVRLYLDGARVGDSDTALAYTLQNVDRGAHSITSAIYDRRGNEKIRSQPVTFYMKQPTIIPPAAVGPNVPPNPGRPRPTPRGGG